MTDFVRVPDPNFDIGKPGRSTDWKRMRDNIDNLNERMIAVEDASIRAFSHFNGRKGFATGGAFNDKIISGGGNYPDYDRFFLQCDGDCYNEIGLNSANDYHYLKFTSHGQVVAEPAFHFANRTKPIRYKFRAKFSDALNNAFYMGLTNFPAYGANSVPVDGIYLEQKSADHTQWRFITTSSLGGGTTTGSDIPRIANDTWFDVEILFENSPGNQARCYLNGVLKETFTTANALATAINLYGRMTFQATAPDLVYLDRALASASGTLSDVP